MKIADNYSKLGCSPSIINENETEVEGKLESHIENKSKDLIGRTFIHNGITVHIGYKDTDRSLVDNLNQYFSQL